MSSRRFGGGDKALALLSGTPLIGWVLERLKPQVDSVERGPWPAFLRHYAMHPCSDSPTP